MKYLKSVIGPTKVNINVIIYIIIIILILYV